MGSQPWQELIEEYALTFFGHGSWKSPTWFIGLEHGVRAENPLQLEDEIRDRLMAWQDCGRGGLIDWCEYANSFKKDEKWLESTSAHTPAIQPTYGKLIRFYLAYLGQGGTAGDETSTDEIREFQKNTLGRSTPGSPAIMELMPMPSKSLNNWLYPSCPSFKNLNLFKTRKQYQDHFAQHRQQMLMKMMEEHRPELVVLYGTPPFKAGQEAFSDLIGRQSDLRGKAIKLCHPVARGKTNSYWENQGREASLSR